MSVHYDFCGYATKNNLLCADGRTIRQDAFKECSGKQVPLVWNHRHDDPEMVIGHAVLENRKDGVFMYGKFNDTDKGRACKKILDNRDINGLSIYANNLKQNGGDVLHGTIREVSLVLAGANPGAIIDYSMAHGEDTEDELYMYLIGDEYTGLKHGDIERGDEVGKEYEDESLAHAEKDSGEENATSKKDDEGDDETIEDVFNTLSEKQKTAVYAIVAAIAGEDDDDDDDEGEDDVKQNAFEQDLKFNNQTYLSHADQAMIIKDAKASGSFRDAFNAFCEANSLQHDAISSGFNQDTSVTGNITYMFPEYKNVRPGAPELITNDQGWVSAVINGAHKSPVSRLRTNQVDIRNLDGSRDSLRARGYIKGKEKQLMGNFEEARRETDPQTIYTYMQLFRDDIIDITDFDYIQYMYNIQRLQLNEELAMATLLGDFRPATGDNSKIQPTHIRPIWTDDELYTIHADVDVAGMRDSMNGTGSSTYFGDNYVYAEAFIQSSLYARENYKGSGNMAMFIHPHTLNVMLLARDMNGRRIFSGRDELASALNVSSIHTVEQFANRIRTDGEGNQHKLLAMMLNMADYTYGSTKGGQITQFTDFDLKFNAHQSLIETRLSGTLTRLWSAIVLEEPVA